VIPPALQWPSIRSAHFTLSVGCGCRRRASDGPEHITASVCCIPPAAPRAQLCLPVCVCSALPPLRCGVLHVLCRHDRANPDFRPLSPKVLFRSDFSALVFTSGRHGHSCFVLPFACAHLRPAAVAADCTAPLVLQIALLVSGQMGRSMRKAPSDLSTVFLIIRQASGRSLRRTCSSDHRATDCRRPKRSVGCATGTGGVQTTCHSACNVPRATRR
jgi:hypothetical protein